MLFTTLCRTKEHFSKLHLGVLIASLVVGAVFTVLLYNTNFNDADGFSEAGAAFSVNFIVTILAYFLTFMSMSGLALVSDSHKTNKKVITAGIAVMTVGAGTVIVLNVVLPSLV